MVTLKSDWFVRLHHASSLLNSREFFALTIMSLSWSDISEWDAVDSRAFRYRSSVIEGYNSIMSKQIKEWVSLLRMFLNHSITECVFLHWFRLVAFTTSELIL